MKQKAFTLLETLMVLVIMILFFAISIPLFSRFMETSKLDTTARNITSAFRTARSYAIANNAEYYVFFDPTTTPDTYFISDQEDGSSWEDKKYKLPTGIWLWDKDTGAINIEFTQGATHPDYGNGVRAARFKPTGELDETLPNASVYISDGNNASAQYKKTITVERTTGKARID